MVSSSWVWLLETSLLRRCHPNRLALRWNRNRAHRPLPLARSRLLGANPLSPGAKTLFYRGKASHDEPFASDPQGETLDILEFLARVLTQIPEPRKHAPHYFGAYSSRARALRKKQGLELEEKLPLTDLPSALAPPFPTISSRTEHLRACRSNTARPSSSLVYFTYRRRSPLSSSLAPRSLTLGRWSRASNPHRLQLPARWPRMDFPIPPFRPGEEVPGLLLLEKKATARTKDRCFLPRSSSRLRG